MEQNEEKQCTHDGCRKFYFKKIIRVVFLDSKYFLLPLNVGGSLAGVARAVKVGGCSRDREERSRW